MGYRGSVQNPERRPRDPSGLASRRQAQERAYRADRADIQHVPPAELLKYLSAIAYETVQRGDLARIMHGGLASMA